MKRIFLTLAAVLAATLAVAPLATSQIPFAIPDMVPSAIPEPIPGGGGVGFKWLTEPSDQSVNEGAELAFSVSLPSAAGYQSCIPSERMTQGPSTHRPGHIRGRHRMPGLEPTP